MIGVDLDRDHAADLGAEILARLDAGQRAADAHGHHRAVAQQFHCVNRRVDLAAALDDLRVFGAET